jgi:hypothetical protein
MKLKLVKMGREAGAGDEVLTKIKLIVEKSRYGAARSVDFKISSERGVDTLQDVLEFGLELGYIHRSGGWHYLYSEPLSGFEKLANADRDKQPTFVAKQNSEDSMKLYLGSSEWFEKLYDLAIAAVTEAGIETVEED